MTMRRASVTLAVGAVASQGVAFVVTLVAAAVYGPTEFGDYAYVLALATTLAPAATLRLEYGIVPARPGDARPLAVLAVLVALALSGALLVVGAIASWAGLLDTFRVPTHLLVFVPVAVVTIALFSILTQIALRQQTWGVLATRGVVQNATIGLVQVSVGSVRPSSVGLLLGEVAGRALGVLLLAAPLVRTGARRPGLSVRTLRRVARENRLLTFAYLPATLLDVLGVALPVLLVAQWFGSSSAGLLALALRILAAPVGLVGLAVGQAVQGVLGQQVREGRRAQSRTVSGLLRRLAVFAVVSAVLFVLVGPVLIERVFGPEWTGAAALVPAVAVLVVSGVVYNPLSTLFVVYEAWTAFFCIALVRVVLLTASGAICFALGAPLATVVLAMATAVFVVDLAACRYGVSLASGE